MDDEQAPGVTWMGAPEVGFVRLPRGQQQMWQNEFYYLDGQVTIHNNESGTDIDLSVAPRTWSDVWRDISTRLDPAKGIVRYGLTRDLGGDRAPSRSTSPGRGPPTPRRCPSEAGSRPREHFCYLRRPRESPVTRVTPVKGPP